MTPSQASPSGPRSRQFPYVAVVRDFAASMLSRCSGLSVGADELYGYWSFIAQEAGLDPGKREDFDAAVRGWLGDAPVPGPVSGAWGDVWPNVTMGDPVAAPSPPDWPLKGPRRVWWCPMDASIARWWVPVPHDVRHMDDNLYFQLLRHRLVWMAQREALDPAAIFETVRRIAATSIPSRQCELGPTPVTSIQAVAKITRLQPVQRHLRRVQAGRLPFEPTIGVGESVADAIDCTFTDWCRRVIGGYDFAL